MGKSLSSVTKLQEFARVTTKKLNNPKSPKPKSKNRVLKPETAKSVGDNSDSKKLKLKMEKEKEKPDPERQKRYPLSEVVTDCTKRWFQDTLKEAKAGDCSMRVLVGQMYYNGYGVHRDAERGKAWMTLASENRPSVWKVSDKRPGYNASDSDSDELKDDVK